MYTVKKTFDKENGNWESDMTYNLLFLRTMQQHATDVLRARGHIYLNEIYDMLGLARTANGAIAGWICDLKNNTLEGFVDFKMHQNDEQIELTFNASESILEHFSKD